MGWGKGREGKGREGKGREEKRREGKGREEKGNRERQIISKKFQDQKSSYKIKNPSLPSN